MGGEVLVLGIVGMLTWLIPFFGLPIPIIGLVWGILILRRKPARKWMLITGMVLCSIGLALSSFYSVISLIDPFTPITTTSPPITNGAPYVPPDTGSVEWIADGVITEGEYTNVMPFGENYELHWKSDGEYIYVAMKATTIGWVAMGILPDLRAEESIDMILGFVDFDTTIYDLFSIYGLFSADHPGLYPQDRALGGSYDIVEFGGAEEIPEEVLGDVEVEQAFSTVIEFKRKLNTGDPYDQPLLEGPNPIIWAYGSDDSRDSSYTERGFGVIVLPVIEN